MRDCGSAPDSGHRELGGHSSSQQRQVHGHGLVTPPVLGAVQVGVHGLADRVRDGVLLRVFRGLRL